MVEIQTSQLEGRGVGGLEKLTARDWNRRKHILGEMGRYIPFPTILQQAAQNPMLGQMKQNSELYDAKDHNFVTVFLSSGPSWLISALHFLV